MWCSEAAAMGKRWRNFYFDMGSPVKIVNLARKMIRLAGYLPEVDIKIEYTGLRPGEKNSYEELLNKKEIHTQNRQSQNYVCIGSGV
jgi:FlaA1/EpsC-like NDP-sugar epimerase